MLGKKLNLPPSALVSHSGRLAFVRLTFVRYLLVLSMVPFIMFSFVFWEAVQMTHFF